jgi:2OG-Fe(II) oxygenase superfamily
VAAVDPVDTIEHESPFDLESALANRIWTYRLKPFPHFVAHEVFSQELYVEMAAQFQQILDRGLCDDPSGRDFARTMKGYDAYATSFRNDLESPLDLFLSREWHDMLARLLGIAATGDVSGGLHHHRTGSASGWAHNDLNPGWFLDRPRPDGINLFDNDICDYQTGRVTVPDESPRENVRAAALLFYLNNEPWTPGDGGETGLYSDASLPVERPSERVAPINNSLLLFECTPNSYHAFSRNLRHPRNSLIMWLHRPKTEVEARWGGKAVAYW